MNQTRFRFFLSTAVIAAVLSSSCGFRIEKNPTDSSGGQTNSDQNERPDGNLTPIDLKPTFASIHQNIFVPKCMSCHNPAGSAKNYPLDTQEQVIDPAAGIVEAGNPGTSSLYRRLLVKCEPGKKCKRMPPPDAGPALSDGEIDIIRQWIVEGANP